MRKLKRHIFTHANNIVVGGDVASLLWALKEDYWVVFTEPRKPFPFEKLPTGDPTQALWEFLALQLNYRGKILGVTPNQSIRADDGVLKVMTKNGRKLVPIKVHAKIRYLLLTRLEANPRLNPS